MPSEVELCSSALLRVGDDPITSLTDDNDRANACLRLYPRVRDMVFRDHTWTCVTKRATLAQENSTVPAIYDITEYRYPFPSDFIRLVDCDLRIQAIPWKIESGAIVAAVPTGPVIRYVYRETDPNKYDTLLSAAIETRLAAWLAIPIAGKKTSYTDMMREYAVILQQAKTADGQEYPNMIPEDNTLIDVRLGIPQYPINPGNAL